MLAYGVRWMLFLCNVVEIIIIEKTAVGKARFFEDASTAYGRAFIEPWTASYSVWYAYFLSGTLYFVHKYVQNFLAYCVIPFFSVRCSFGRSFGRKYAFTLLKQDKNSNSNNYNQKQETDSINNIFRQNLSINEHLRTLKPFFCHSSIHFCRLSSSYA